MVSINPDFIDIPKYYKIFRLVSKYSKVFRGFRWNIFRHYILSCSHIFQVFQSINDVPDIPKYCIYSETFRSVHIHGFYNPGYC